MRISFGVKSTTSREWRPLIPASPTARSSRARYIPGTARTDSYRWISPHATAMFGGQESVNSANQGDVLHLAKPAFVPSRAALGGDFHGRGLIDLVDGVLERRVEFGVAHRVPEVLGE